MIKFLIVIYIIYLKRLECFKCKKSGELQQAHHVSNVNSLIHSAAFSSPKQNRVGIGYDIHRIVDDKNEGRSFKLGGVTFPDDSLRIISHSDGDVVFHSISDAILGALGKGDIGEYFPDSDPRYNNYDSSNILLKVLDMMKEMNYFLVNVDVCIILETPKLGSIKNQIRDNLNYLLGYNTIVNIKAKTNEKLDSLGKGSAVACHSVALLQYVY